MKEVIFSETSDPTNVDYHTWARGYVKMRRFTNTYDVLMRVQTEYIIRQLDTNRNWILLISKSPSYIQRLYNNIAISHAYTNRKTSQILDPTDLVSILFSKDDTVKALKIEELISDDLLMVNYTDIKNQGVAKIGGNIQSILRKRKSEKLPTIFEIFEPDLSKTGVMTISAMTQLAHIYGKYIMDLLREDTKFIKVNTR